MCVFFCDVGEHGADMTRHDAAAFRRDDSQFEDCSENGVGFGHRSGGLVIFWFVRVRLELREVEAGYGCRSM